MKVRQILPFNADCSVASPTAILRPGPGISLAQTIHLGHRGEKRLIYSKVVLQRFICNASGTTGYSALCMGNGLHSIFQHKSSATTMEFYQQRDDPSEANIWVHLPMNQGEHIDRIETRVQYSYGIRSFPCVERFTITVSYILLYHSRFPAYILVTSLLPTAGERSRLGLTAQLTNYATKPISDCGYRAPQRQFERTIFL